MATGPPPMNSPPAPRAGAPDGLLLIDKPSGPTSHDVVARVRRIDRKARVGHTGTLDPMATGLLVVCIGGATRLQQFLTGLGKVYTGRVRLGFATDTYDAEGEPAGPKGDPSSIDDDAIRGAASRFVGEIDQLPPPFSARKVAGERMYEIARRGDEVARTPKRIRIARFEVSPRDGDEIPFLLEGSSGTYVRSVAHELGEALGVGGHLSSLRRTAVGPFRLDDALPLDRWEALPREEAFAPPHFVPLGRIPLPFPRFAVDERQRGLLLHGQAVLLRGTGAVPEGSLVALEDGAGGLLAIGAASAGETWLSVQPRIVFG